ncbi:MAG: hypothetical protein Q8S84_09600 [bacterium]|nr:hypothetical protein [bacterium]MDP3381667.1 hypothetical protein [bacterium]
MEFCISKVPKSGAYKSTIYLSQGEITILSINVSFSYFQISDHTSFILTHGILKLNILVFATSVKYTLTTSHFFILKT